MILTLFLMTSLIDSYANWGQMDGAVFLFIESSEKYIL